jgi:type I restriction enzyme S subunit
MKAGWEIKTLGEVCVIDKKQGIHKNLPYVGLENIESNTGQFLGSIDSIEVKSSTFKFSPEHLLYGRLRPYLNKVMLPDFSGHCSTEIFPIKPNAELLREFLQYWFFKEDTVEQINATCTGARMPRANMNEVLDFEFPLPPLPEQKRLVTLLDEAFESIATAKANAQQNLKNARALFESHLNEVFTKRGEGWEEKTLVEVCAEIFAGGDVPKDAFSKNETAEFKVPVYANGEKNKGLFGYTNKPRTSEPSITISARGTIGYSEIRTQPFYPVVRLIVIVPKKEILDLSFVQFVISNIDFVHSGSSIPQLTVPMVKEYKIPFPPLSEQKNIVHKLDNLREETQRLEALYSRKIAALDELKKALLHRAFSGEL